MLFSKTRNQFGLKSIAKLGLLFAALLSLILFAVDDNAMAQQSVNRDGEALKLRISQKTATRAKQILERYCGKDCHYIRSTVDLEESLIESNDLGFEGDEELAPVTTWSVENIRLNIQIDKKVTERNVARLETILKTHLSSLAPIIQVDWLRIEAPRIGEDVRRKEQLFEQVRARITNAAENVFQKYCPEQCAVDHIEVYGDLSTIDDVTGLPQNQVVRDPSSGLYLKISDIKVRVTLDESLRANERQRIQDVLRSRLSFYSPMQLIVNLTTFPESFSDRQRRLQADADDPYGLDKLRETLTIFKELAGTKEVITSSENQKKQETTDSVINWWTLFLLLGVGLLGVYAVFKWQRIKQDAAYMEQLAFAEKKAIEKEKPDEKPEKDEGLQESVKINALKEELLGVFTDFPKVAKETFGRFLQEEGVEETAKYVAIFGKVVIFDLLDDPGQRRNVYALSEYYHKSDFNFKPEEILKLLEKLKTKVTANEIKLLARQTSDQFEFLARLDSGQVHALVKDETTRIQSIVLTQLDAKRRRIVFEMFEGQAKVDLLKELCQAEAIPKEFLANVARAMHKKIKSRPEFDTENLRSNDILLDLLEKSDFESQRALMHNLEETNSDASRAIKMRLVTVHMLAFLKEGHLLEIILGMEREDLLTFLTGADPAIGSLLLSKAPEELAESWQEDLEHVNAVDDGKYRVVEMQVLSRIRTLANNGMINLLEINDMLYGSQKEQQAQRIEEARSNPDAQVMTGNQVVA